MEGILSQDEIDALLGGGSVAEEEKPVRPQAKSAKTMKLTREEEDAIGEIGNISLGTSATTLAQILGKDVSITTPRVDVTSFDELKSKTDYGEQVLIEIEYKAGFFGINLLLIDKKDAIIIGDLMMGNDGTNPPDELDDLYLSAVGEAMNQMIGSASTSMSSMIKQPVDINAPQVTLYDIEELKRRRDFFQKNAEFVTVTFDMEIQGLVNTKLFQIMDIDFVREITRKLYGDVHEKPAPKKAEQHRSNTYEREQENMAAQNQNQWQGSNMNQPQQQMGWGQQQNMGMPPQYAYQNPNMGMGYGMQPPPQMGWSQPVNVQPVQFASFGEAAQRNLPSNIDLIMDVQMQVTVELGRTKMQIKEILDLGPGSIVELDKLAGEPVDILVNNKLIAKGEVVVIDESFGVRITDIISQMERINKVQ